ncbi:MAG: XRE family transcriptional regulator [Planctomycetota bacterium]|nr:MAG: XRE family transcriptional regulator [Planctomycetota bacterium]
MARRENKPRGGGRKPGRWELVRPEEIREYRARKGLSRARLARALGVSATSIQNWESGRAASLATQRRLRAFLDGRAEPLPGAEGSAVREPALDASAVLATGSIVATYLESRKEGLRPSQIAQLVRGVRRALNGTPDP